MSSLRSSIERLQEAVIASDLELLGSPPSSIDSRGTGATGSSEAPGTATMSLMASITASSRRLDKSISTPSAISSYNTAHSDAPPTTTQREQEEDALGGDHSGGVKLGRPFSSGASDWSEMSVPRSPVREREIQIADDADHLEEEKPEGGEQRAGSTSSHMNIEASVQMTDAEEAEGLDYTMDRDPTRFKHWLATSTGGAADDDSENGSYYNYQASDCASQGVRLPTPDDSPSPRASSRFSSVNPSDYENLPASLCGRIGSRQSRRTMTASDVTGELESLLPSEVISVKFEEEDMVKVEEYIVKVEEYIVKKEQEQVVTPKAEEVDEKVEAQDLTEQESSDEAESETSSNSTTTVSTGSSSGRWKALSAVLGLGLAANVTQQHLPYLLTLFGGSSSLDEEPENRLTILMSNATNAFPEPILVGSPLPVSAIVAVAIVVASSLTYAVQNYSSPAKSSITSMTRVLDFNVRKERHPIPKRDPAISTRMAHASLAEGERLYQLGRLSHASTAFEEACKLSITSLDRAISNEWLGRTQYRQGRAEHAPRLFHAAVAAFERSVRFDRNRATSRASLGRTHFVLYDYVKAEKLLLSALRVDNTLAFAHEYLGKTRVALHRWPEAEVSLGEAIRLNPASYETLAFLGEMLHRKRRSTDAKVVLQAALGLRADYPAVHARLAMIATEELEQETAIKHWQAVLACRETGCIDDNLPRTLSAIVGPRPYLYQYFAIQKQQGLVGRIEILRQAAAKYPVNGLVSALLAVNLRRSTGSPSRTDRHNGMGTLRTMEQELEKKVTIESDDVEAKGLFALVLLGLGKVKRGEMQAEEFEEAVRRAPKEGDGKARDFGLILMALGELR
ncbi:hypothetical protein P7C70_g7481, partial [Phenoliferia sp. Uapishka_3]